MRHSSQNCLFSGLSETSFSGSGIGNDLVADSSHRSLPSCFLGKVANLGKLLIFSHFRFLPLRSSKTCIPLKNYILNDFTLIMNVGCSFTDNPYISDFQNTGSGVKVDLLRADRDSRTQHAYFNIKKGFRVPLVLTFKATATNSLYQTAYQQVLSDNRSSMIDGSLSLASKFKSLFNIEVGYKLTLQQSKIGISDQTINFAQHEVYVKPILFRKECFELNVPVSFVLDHSGQDEFHNFDLGLSAMFSLKRWTFTVEGRNMLHTRMYCRLRVESQNDYNEIITENRLPGYIITGVKFMF